MTQTNRLFRIPSPRFPQRPFMMGAIATASALASIFSPALASAVQASFHDSPKAILDEAWQIVNQEYVDDTFNQVDWQLVRQDLLSQDYSSREEAYAALVAALEQLEDPYTRFMTPEQFEELTNQTSGELSGIGIRLQVNSTLGVLEVVEPLPNSPAQQAGIRSGDRILAINGQSTQGMSVQTASQIIRGEVGTSISLRVERSGSDAFDLDLTRALIEVPSVHYRLQQEGDHRIGYIRLTEFSSHAPEQMQAAIEVLTAQQVDGFVLDLRGNPGGLLSASIDISRMWLDSGAIVQTVDRHGDGEDIVANHTALTQQPLAVLVDGRSASSSEILTGALQDNHRAIVIGTQTFGKALVQSVHSLADGSGLAVTVAHYYTPNGTDISHRGITPDVQMTLTSQQRRDLTSNPELWATAADPYYMRAITSLEVEILANRLTTPTQLGSRTTTPSLVEMNQ